MDTDFTAKLVDVWPDGFAQNLTEGILRASYRESTTGTAKPIVPGKVYEYKIDHVVHEQCLPEGPPDSPGSQQQQLPALRPQPEYRQVRQHELPSS